MDSFINVTETYLPGFDEYMEEIRALWDTHWITNMGEKHEEFKRRLKAYLGIENLELFVNGHMALEMTLQSMKLSGEVITTPFTFGSTTHAIVRSGLAPVFVIFTGIHIRLMKIGSRILSRKEHVQSFLYMFMGIYAMLKE